MTSSILLFGATSILGFRLASLFPHTISPYISPGNTAQAVRHWPALELDNPNWLHTLFSRTQPKILLYCHAVCDVAKCEAHPDWAYKVNVLQVKHTIQQLPQKTKLVYVSSDHVFGGDGIYDEASPPSPISRYGKTRVEAEQVVLNRPNSLVLRIGLGIGDSPNGRTGHLDWLRYRSQRNLPITIIEDEYRSVVWASDLAQRIMEIAKSEETGVRHICATRAVSRVELANHLIKTLGIPTSYKKETRIQQSVPHLGYVELRSRYHAPLFQALPSVLDNCPY